MRGALLVLTLIGLLVAIFLVMKDLSPEDGAVDSGSRMATVERARDTAEKATRQLQETQQRVDQATHE
jgi:hypothetical protein